MTCEKPWCLLDALPEAKACAVHLKHPDYTPTTLEQREVIDQLLADPTFELTTAPEKCDTCNGTGECQCCDGTGELSCDNVSCSRSHSCQCFDGKCDECEGTGFDGEAAEAIKGLDLTPELAAILRECLPPSTGTSSRKAVRRHA